MEDYAGAPASQRENFVYSHIESKYPCEEWRFGGKLGFGGKYWSGSNTVSCYNEDSTPELSELIELINHKLSQIF